MCEEGEEGRVNEQHEWSKWCPTRIWLVEHLYNDGHGLYDVFEEPPGPETPSVEYVRVDGGTDDDRSESARA